MDLTFAAGDLVALFPEGRLTQDGELGLFQEALWPLLAQSRVPILPVRMDGLWGSFFSRRRRGALRARIALRVGAPLQDSSPELLRGALLALKEAS